MSVLAVWVRQQPVFPKELDMNSLDELHRSVQTTLASNRLGTPVFVRYIVQRPAAEPALAGLARIAGVVRGWLGAPVREIYAVGSAEQRHITLTLELQNAATALITWIGTPGRGSGVDLLVVGNHGTLQHDGGDAPLWDETPALGDAAPDQELLALVQRALTQGRPVVIGETP
jgi:hypothetical protein